MKKLLYLIPFLVSLVYADSITSGKVGLLIISTGVYSTRSPGDKINSNFSIIASTLNTVLENSIPLTVNDEGTALSGGIVSKINCVGAGLACTQSGSTVTATVTATGGGADSSTRTFSIGSGGDVFLASNTVIPIPGAWGAVSRSTINIIGVQAFLGYPSTNQATGFLLAVATGTGLGGIKTTWAWRTPHIVVSTGSTFSDYISTSFPLWAGEIYALHISTIPINPPLPSEYKMILHGWVQPNYP